MTTTLFVCETCGYDSGKPDAVRPGELFARALEQQLAEQPLPQFELKRIKCLMACKRSCNVHLRAPGKLGYVIGDFNADAESAGTLLDYCGKYQLSETGQVPFSTWPQGIKGKFVARVPALD
jgi:predicted metal-binding protein